MQTSSQRVKLLDPNTINQIAAGEVVERPASVVKELVENSIDAGATRIDVELEHSGRTLIRVSDNGYGMSSEDASACLQRHATSKIRSTADLSQVVTLGFRGEAMPSIASVSRMTVSTSQADGLRTVVRVIGGDIELTAGESGPMGTTITVEDLFFNTPARLKFLKTDSTELSATLEHLSKYAIAYPSIAFSVTHNGQQALRSTGSGDLLEAIGDVWSREVARGLAEVDNLAGGIHVSGFISPPHFTKPTRAFQFVFVNRRPVKTRTVVAAVDQAFRDLTPERRFPIVALNLDIDPERIDVNVSPTKSEIKFQHEGAAFDSIRYAIRSALSEHGMMPSADAIANVNEALRGQQASFSSFNFSIPSGPSSVEASILAQIPLASDPTFAEIQSGVPTEVGRYPFIELLDGLQVLGQVFNTFIVASTRRGIVILDQHVAHERILYEYLCGLRGPSAIEQQKLLTPETLHLDKRSALLLQDRLQEVIDVGFDLEPFGGESFLVRAAPAALRGKSAIGALRDIVDDLAESIVSNRITPTREQIWITTSCKMAVKSGDPLTKTEMEKLISDLATTENPYMCPHGRPITLTLTLDELCRKFKRT